MATLSVGLYLLVSFNVGSKTAVKNARWTMYIHKSADFVFLLAVILTYKTFGSFDLDTLREQWLLMSESPINDPMIFVNSDDLCAGVVSNDLNFMCIIPFYDFNDLVESR